MLISILFMALQVVKYNTTRTKDTVETQDEAKLGTRVGVMMQGDYDHEYTNPMMEGRGREDAMRGDGGEEIPDMTLEAVEDRCGGRNGDDMYDEGGRMNNRRVPPLNRILGEGYSSMYDSHDDNMIWSKADAATTTSRLQRQRSSTGLRQTDARPANYQQRTSPGHE